MANQRGIVAGWDATNSRPKGVTSAADMRASLQMIATHPGIMTEPGAATITLPSNAMRINWTAFTAVIRSTLGGWYTPRIEAGGIALSIGNVTYPRIDVVWVRQRDYQTNASWPDSEVEVGVAQGTASATPSTPAVPTGALAVFTVRVPAGATTGSAIGLANVTAAARTAPAGGIITAASQAEMDAIAAAAGAYNGLYVMRTDLGALTWWDGTRWNLSWQRIVVVNAVTNVNGIVVISYDLGGVVPSMILCTLMQGPYESINKIATPTVHSITATSAQIRFRREDENGWMAGQAVTFAALVLR